MLPARPDRRLFRTSLGEQRREWAIVVNGKWPGYGEVVLGPHRQVSFAGSPEQIADGRVPCS
jgi:hypothetical protein